MTTNDVSEQLTAAQLNFDRDRKRIRGRRRALLDLLWDGRWYANYECARAGGVSFHCSIYTLRREGWAIESRYVSGGVWEYRLTGRGAPRDARRSLTRPQTRVARELMHAVRSEYGEDGMVRVRERLAPWLAAALRATD
jgi:hypothetical protein